MRERLLSIAWLPALCWMLLSASAPATVAGAPPDGIDLTIAKGPGASELTLSWTGGSPTFDVFRATDPAAVIDPLNLDGQTAASSFVTTEGTPTLELFRIAAPPLADITGTYVDTANNTALDLLSIVDDSGGSFVISGNRE